MKVFQSLHTVIAIGVLDLRTQKYNKNVPTICGSVHCQISRSNDHMMTAVRTLKRMSFLYMHLQSCSSSKSLTIPHIPIQILYLNRPTKINDFFMAFCKQ